MSDRRNTFGWIGIVLGSIALMLALVHFYAGPFSPQPSLEQAVAEKAVAIRNATIAALKGNSAIPDSVERDFDADQLTEVAVASLGGIAVILGFVGFARKESYRVALGAAGLGSASVAFQFLTIAIGAVVFAIILAAVLGSLGIS